MTVREAIWARKSIRKYKDKDKPIPQEQIDALLEAAMKAPSGCNVRPWSFIVARSRETLEKLARVHPFTKMVGEASLAIIVCLLPDVQTRMSEGFMAQDCGAATQNILLLAAELGLGTCWCGVYPKEEAMQRTREALGGAIAPNAVPFNIIAVGYPDEDFGSRGVYDKSKVAYI